jgi:hypothetical protein
MDINIEVIFIIVIAVVVISSSLVSILFGIYNKYYHKNPKLNIYNNTNHNPPNELGDPRFNSVSRTRTIVNSGPSERPVDNDEEYVDALPVYEPRNDSYGVNRIDDINESIGMQIVISRPEPVHECTDRPPTYRF